MGFDFAEVLSGIKDVPISGTGQEQIEYLPLASIKSDGANFYSLDGVEELAANIELVGLQQPLRVRSDPEGDGVIIVSGHRRVAALRLLAQEGKAVEPVACIREAASSESPELRELRLIFANSDTRKMTAADISRQAERVETLLYQLKEQGLEFPGRMRDHVAEACKVSKSKLSRLKVIREGLTEPHLLKGWSKGDLAESTAYVLAQQSPERQIAIFALIGSRRELKYLYQSEVANFVADADRLEARKCKKCESGRCDNAKAILQNLHATSTYSYKPCRYDTNKCCNDCENLATCKTACPLLADKVKRLKEDKKAAARQEKLAQEAKDAPDVQMISNLFQRFCAARLAAGLDVKDAMTAMGHSYWQGDETIIKLENLAVKITPDIPLAMYGFVMRLEDFKPLIKAADAFGCSTDYLLCRTNKKNGEREARPFKWQAGTPERPGEYAAIFTDEGVTIKEVIFWDGKTWRYTERDFDSCLDGESVFGWFPLPGNEGDGGRQ